MQILCISVCLQMKICSYLICFFAMCFNQQSIKVGLVVFALPLYFSKGWLTWFCLQVSNYCYSNYFWIRIFTQLCGDGTLRQMLYCQILYTTNGLDFERGKPYDSLLIIWQGQFQILIFLYCYKDFFAWISTIQMALGLQNQNTISSQIKDCNTVSTFQLSAVQIHNCQHHYLDNIHKIFQLFAKQDKTVNFTAFQSWFYDAGLVYNLFLDGFLTCFL